MPLTLISLMEYEFTRFLKANSSSNMSALNLVFECLRVLCSGPVFSAFVKAYRRKSAPQDWRAAFVELLPPHA